MLDFGNTAFDRDMDWSECETEEFCACSNVKMQDHIREVVALYERSQQMIVVSKTLVHESSALLSRLKANA